MVMRLWRLFGTLLLSAVLLSGCLYPKELRKENQMASGEYVMVVQNAIDQYKAKTGVLPIKNSTENTPIYEKYPVDFRKLQGPYLSSIPVNAFENGGTAAYVLVDVETKPAVKMMDIPSFQKKHWIFRRPLTNTRSNQEASFRWGKKFLRAFIPLITKY